MDNANLRGLYKSASAQSVDVTNCSTVALLFGGTSATTQAHAATASPDGSLDAALALALLREMAAAVYLMNPDGRITLVNPAGLAQLELDSHADAGGRFLWDLWPDVPAEVLQAALADACDGEVTRISARCPAPGGRLARCAVTVTPVEDGAGQVAKVLAIARMV